MRCPLRGCLPARAMQYGIPHPSAPTLSSVAVQGQARNETHTRRMVIGDQFHIPDGILPTSLPLGGAGCDP